MDGVVLAVDAIQSPSSEILVQRRVVGASSPTDTPNGRSHEEEE